MSAPAGVRPGPGGRAAAPGGPIAAGPADIVAIVRDRAERTPDAVAFSFVDYAADRAGSARAVDYEALDERARAIAAEIQRRCSPGDRVAVCCPHSFDYVEAWLGCLYSGSIAVPLSVPEQSRHTSRLQGVLADCAPRCVLTTAEARPAVESLLDALSEHAVEDVISVDELDDGAVADWRDVPRAPGDLAYLQYTSGSTREPAGVRVTHANMLAGVRQIERQSEMGPDSVVVSWLPYFHDMGLISGIVLPLGAGAHAVHLTPLAFIQEPARWLRLISEYRATWTAAPNFAYDLCVRRIGEEQRRDLDLRSLTSLTNGSEQVRPGSIEEFEAAFGPCGLDPVADSPGYGLAEATLGVTSADRGAVIRTFDRAELTGGRAHRAEAGTVPVRALVSCGRPLPGVTVLIADPETGAGRADGDVGEIWVHGENVADGYWERPELTRAVFVERPGGPPGARWLRTGDLGFLHEGELYVTGRRKELVIVDGRNHAPADIELTVELAHPAIRQGGVAAFAVNGASGEGLGLAAELRGSARQDAGVRDEVTGAVRREVAAEHGLEVRGLVFVRPGTLPKTTSGKIQREACRELYAAGALTTAGG